MSRSYFTESAAKQVLTIKAHTYGETNLMTSWNDFHVAAENMEL